MTDTDEHAIENNRRQYSSRRFSSREITLGIGLLFNFSTLVWYVSAANARLETMRIEMNELKQSNATLVGAVNRNTLLEYRITQLEARQQVDEARRRP